MKRVSTFALLVMLALGSAAWGLIAYTYAPADVRALLLGHGVEHNSMTD
jgi:hypothetical protein